MTHRTAMPFLLSTALLLSALPATAQVSLPASATRPPQLRHQKATETVEYRVRINPGVAEVNTAATVSLSLASILEKRDARFGTRKPIDDAALTAYLVLPGGKKVLARQVQKLRDAGSYGFVFTSGATGIHNLVILGTSKSAGKIEYSLPLSFGVWPIPKSPTLPRLPRKLPSAEFSDASAGRALCEKHCRQDLDFALPKGTAPTYLDSAAVNSMSDATLLETVAGSSQARSLNETDRRSLLTHLHTLHYGIRDFFPKASRYMVTDFTINEFGLDRLDETARLTLAEDEKTASVIIVYKGEKRLNRPELVDFEDRTARDSLPVSDKIGYIVFQKGPTESLHELAIGLHLEPTYPISEILARNKDGVENSKVAASLRTFRGLGRFNDARSLRRGSPSLRGPLLPLYLRAAEFATMYYSDEREFTAFDGEFADLD